MHPVNIRARPGRHCESWRLSLLVRVDQNPPRVFPIRQSYPASWIPPGALFLPNLKK